MAEEVPDFGGRSKLSSLCQRPEMIAQNMPGRVCGFRTVRWSFSGDTLAPADRAVHIGFHEDDPANVGAFRAGFEWSHQLHPHFSQRDFSNAHASSVARFS